MDKYTNDMRKGKRDISTKKEWFKIGNTCIIEIIAIKWIKQAYDTTVWISWIIKLNKQNLECLHSSLRTFDCYQGFKQAWDSEYFN